MLCAYEANLNSKNTLGTIASIEYVLRRLDCDAEEEQSKCERMENALVGYCKQLGCPFEDKAYLRELLLQQQDINKLLDLDKGDVREVVNDNMP